MSKIERKFLAHFIAAGDSFVRLGQDLQEYSPEMSATVEKTKNILGQTAVTISGYEKSAAELPDRNHKGGEENNCQNNADRFQSFDSGKHCYTRSLSKFFYFYCIA